MVNTGNSVKTQPPIGAPITVAPRPRIPLKVKVIGAVLLTSSLGLIAVGISFALANRQLVPPRNRRFEGAYHSELAAKQELAQTVFSYDYGNGVMSLEKPSDQQAARGQIAVSPGYLQVLRDDLAKERSHQLDEAIASKESFCYRREREVCASYYISLVRTDRIVPVLGSMGSQRFYLTTACSTPPKIRELITTLSGKLSGLTQIQATLKANPQAQSQANWLAAQIAELKEQLAVALLELGNEECSPIPVQLILAMSAIDISAWLDANNAVTANNLSIDPSQLILATSTVLDKSVERLRATNRLDAAAELEQITRQREEFEHESLH